MGGCNFPPFPDIAVPIPAVPGLPVPPVPAFTPPGQPDCPLD